MSSDRDQSPSTKFDWPPSVDQTRSHPPPTPIQIRLPHPLIESIETQLLGRTGLVFDQWALSSGWTRDSSDLYCWRCGGSIGLHESDGEGCANCHTKTLPWERTIRLGRHTDKLREEVLALKFARWRATGDGLGIHLGLAIREQLKLAQIDAQDAALVPIPIHRLRRVTRGVDHTLVLARGASKSSGCPIQGLLSTKWRPEQVGLSKTTRAQNTKDAFFFSRRGMGSLKKTMAQDKRLFILIDDVRTTGATFVAASKALKSAFLGELNGFSETSHPLRIWVACIGVAGENRRLESDEC